jgi:GT2 family glycosyltransferase
MRTLAESVTVIVPTIGRPVLSDCLAALLEAAVRPGRAVVVDQSADDAMRRLVDEARAMGLEAVYVPSGQRGAAAARNRGLERATTRFVATIDDDCCVAPDWTERLIDRLLAHPGAVITGRVESAGSQEQPSTMISAVQAVYRQPLRDRDPLFSGNMAAERSVFERVGLFNEHPALLPAAEDNEWGYRALLAGVPIVYAPEVAVRHLDWRSADQLTATYRRYARGQGGFYGLHLRKGDWFIGSRALRDLARGLWVVFRGLGSRDKRLLEAGRSQVAELLAGVLAGLRGGVSP